MWTFWTKLTENANLCILGIIAVVVISVVLSVALSTLVNFIIFKKIILKQCGEQLEKVTKEGVKGLGEISLQGESLEEMAKNLSRKLRRKV